MLSESLEALDALEASVTFRMPVTWRNAIIVWATTVCDAAHAVNWIPDDVPSAAADGSASAAAEASAVLGVVA